MTKPEEQLQAIAEMRDLMNKSSRFLSLSGLSGVFAGIYSLIGAGVAYWYINTHFGEYYDTRSIDQFIRFFFADAISVILLTLITAFYHTSRKAKKRNEEIWSSTSMRLSINFAIPLCTGGVLCLALVFHGFYILVAPMMLLFYGLALLNASKYTLHDLRFLGLTQIALGLINTFVLGYGLFFWTIGFGVVHIVYGLIMYYKYER
ncbi:MAG: hypothetical protein GY827_04320 [Cytophagales bacterium]|nr:hypothetical protein [Cytophagales bacterium]